LAKSTGGFQQIHSRIWANPLQDFSGFCKWLENKAIEKRKNYCSEVAKLLCRSWPTSLQNFANFSAEVWELDWRRAKASAEKLKLDTQQRAVVI
jgi:hypothetical protein